jgi:hypothetical protein
MAGRRTAYSMVRFTAIAATSLILVACSTVGGSSDSQQAGDGVHDVERGAMPDGRPDIRGMVTEIRHEPGGEPSSKRILVEESPRDCSKSKGSKGCTKLYLDITERTPIFRKMPGKEGAFTRARITDLQRGQRVLAWHSGVLTKSYPGQGHARAIVINDN